MPAYIWSCLSCGTANAAAVSICTRCTCPAAASTRQIGTYRLAWQNSGGTVEAGAGKLPEAGDNDVSKALLAAALRTMWLLIAGTSWK